MFVALAMLLTPSHAARTVQFDSSSCAIGQVHFDGACRDPSWFESLAAIGWTLDRVSGPTLESRDYVVLHESRADRSRSVALAPTGDSKYTRQGYPVVARMVEVGSWVPPELDRATLEQTYGTLSEEANNVLLADVPELRPEVGDYYIYNFVLYDAAFENGQIDVYHVDFETDAMGTEGTQCDFTRLCVGRPITMEVGLIDTDFIMGLIDTDFIMGSHMVDAALVDALFGG